MLMLIDRNFSLGFILYQLNTHWYKKGMNLFMLVTAAHFLEHVVQVYQLWVLHLPRPQCLGLLGSLYPWLMHSEWLHYGHALFMLLGLAVFRPSMEGKSRVWWDIAFTLQFFHHFEHALLLGQVIIGRNLFDLPVRTSIGQLWFPRIELHFWYNLIVLFPMLIGLSFKKNTMS